MRCPVSTGRRAIPECSWMLDDITAMQLDELWQDYVERVHVLVEEQEEDIKSIQCYKEKDKGNFPLMPSLVFMKKKDW